MNSSWLSRADAACEIIRTANYIESAAFRRIPALPGSVLVEIRSQLLDAKNPEGTQARYQGIMTIHALQRLRTAIDAALQLSDREAQQ